MIAGAVCYTNSGCPNNELTCPVGYYSNVSVNGSSFNASPSLVTIASGTGGGAQSRVIATSANSFDAFVPTLNNPPGCTNNCNLPTAVVRWTSSNGTTWTNAGTVFSFGAPANNSPPAASPVIFYAPLLNAQGYTDGRWTVAFLVNNGGYTNVEDCTSDRGCGLVNPCPDFKTPHQCTGTDQFLAGTGTYNDKGYWISYYTYTTQPRALPLVTQAIYCPPGSACIGATTYNPGIDPTKWELVSRCPPKSGGPTGGACNAAGDFQGIAAGRTANQLPSSSDPFVLQSQCCTTSLFQVFVQDPQAPATPANFIPDTIWFPLGSDITYLSGPLPPGTDMAFAPGEVRGVPDLVVR